jgi:pimeloyl-ACP methyl ester carboxylesterase
MSTSGQPSAPAGPTTQSMPTPVQGPTPKPSTPVLPSSIAKPILPTTGSLTPASASAAGSAASSVPAPARPADALSNPLLPILSGVKPVALLLKHVDRDIPDLDTLRAEVEKTDENALLKSAQSFASVNLALELKRLITPTLLLHGENDSLLPPPSEDLLQRINAGKQAGHFLTLVEPELRHFPMLEVTAKFNRLLIDFLEAPDLTNVQFKDQWKRTMR